MITIAHRGLLSNQNRLRSIVEAEQRADIVEFDVCQDTRGTLVICHDTDTAGFKNDTFQSLVDYPFRLHCMVDIKVAGALQGRQIARDIVKMVTHSNHTWYLCSFNEFCVDELYRQRGLARYKIGVITTGIPINMFDHLNIDFVSIDYNFIDNETVKFFKSKNILVFAYTINNKYKEEYIKHIDVDGVVTDLF